MPVTKSSPGTYNGPCPLEEKKREGCKGWYKVESEVTEVELRSQDEWSFLYRFLNQTWLTDIINRCKSLESTYYVLLFLLFSCVWLCDPMNCSTPGFPVLHYLPELAQTHVHWVSDAIQPPHPLSSPFHSVWLMLLRSECGPCKLSKLFFLSVCGS